MDIKVIVLDFDGVILETVGIKDWAFETLFQEYPDHLDEIMKFHLQHNAMIRFDKFEHITENILNKSYTDQEKNRLSRGFSDLTLKKILECPKVDGIVEFLEYFSKRVPIYIATVNPPEEFDSILVRRDLKKYFKDVYTVPWVKKDAINDILARESVRAEQVLFIGDSVEDYNSAKATNVNFIGRLSNKSFGEEDIPQFKTMTDVKDFVLSEKLDEE